jgi:hypothetical protein
MSIAATFVIGMSTNALLTYKDVRIDPKKRNTMVRDWGEGGYQPLTGKVIWWNSWQKLAPEGLGVDHDKWLEGKRSTTKTTKLEKLGPENYDASVDGLCISRLIFQFILESNA